MKNRFKKKQPGSNIHNTSSLWSLLIPEKIAAEKFFCLKIGKLGKKKNMDKKQQPDSIYKMHPPCENWRERQIKI